MRQIIWRVSATETGERPADAHFMALTEMTRRAYNAAIADVASPAGKPDA